MRLAYVAVEQVRSRQSIERVQHEPLVGLATELVRHERSEPRHRVAAIAVSPDQRRRAVQRMRFLSLLVVNDGLTPHLLGEESCASRPRKGQIGGVHDQWSPPGSGGSITLAAIAAVGATIESTAGIAIV